MAARFRPVALKGSNNLGRGSFAFAAVWTGQCQRLGWDVSRVTIAKIETGVRAVNDGEVVVLASVLKSTPGEILDKVKVTKAMKVVRQGKTETER